MSMNLCFKMSSSENDTYVQRTFPQDAPRLRSAVISEAYGRRINSYLMGYSEDDKHFCHLVKRRDFGCLTFHNVSVRIPRFDRANTDLQRLPWIIVEIVGKACTMYRLCYKIGVLNTCYGAGDLELFTGSFEFATQEDATQNAAVVYETTLNVAIIATMDQFVTIKRVESLLIGRAKELIMKKCVVLMPLYKVVLMIHRLAVHL